METNLTCSFSDCSHNHSRHKHCSICGFVFIYECNDKDEEISKYLKSSIRVYDGIKYYEIYHQHCHLCTMTHFHIHCEFNPECEIYEPHFYCSICKVCSLTKHIHCKKIDCFIPFTHTHCFICNKFTTEDELHSHCRYCNSVIGDEYEYCDICEDKHDKYPKTIYEPLYCSCCGVVKKPDN